MCDDAHPMAAVRGAAAGAAQQPGLLLLPFGAAIATTSVTMRAIPEERFYTIKPKPKPTDTDTDTGTDTDNASDNGETKPMVLTSTAAAAAGGGADVVPIQPPGGMLAASWPQSPATLQHRRRRFHGGGMAGLSFRLPPLGNAWTVMEGMSTDEDTTLCGMTFSEADRLLEQGTAMNIAAAAAAAAKGVPEREGMGTPPLAATAMFAGAVPLSLAPRVPSSPSLGGSSSSRRRRSSTPPPARTRSGSAGKAGKAAGKAGSTQTAKLRTTLKQFGASG